jgi:hypothetical protein
MYMCVMKKIIHIYVYVCNEKNYTYMCICVKRGKREKISKKEKKTTGKSLQKVLLRLDVE